MAGSRLRTTASKARRRARLLSARLRRQRSGRREPWSWEVPAPVQIARPDLVVAMVASDRLRAGFADQWVQRPVSPEDLGIDGADLVLVELAAGTIPGFGAVASPAAARLIQLLGSAQVPVVLWVTAGGPPAGADRAGLELLLATAGTVLVADLLEEWREVVPGAALLGPAAPARRSPRYRPREATEVRGLILSAGVDETASRSCLETISSGLSPIAERIDAFVADDVSDRRGALPSPFAEKAGVAAYAAMAGALNRTAVLVEGARRTPGDTWNLLTAAGTGTSVVSVAGLPQPAGLVVAAPADPKDLRAEVVARLNQPELVDREGLELRRAVLAQHTFGHRARTLLAAAGRVEPEPVVPTVSAVVPTNRTHEIDNVLANIARQVHPAVELVLVLHGLDVDEAEVRARARDLGVTELQVIMAPSHLTLGACLNLGVDAASGDLVAKMDDDNYYGRHYLIDLTDALRSQNAGIAGKWGHYVWLRSTGAVVLRYPNHENRWVRRIQGGSMLFEGDVVRSLRFGDLPRAVDSDILDRAIAEGVSIWSADRYNYVSVRGEDNAAHTWTVEDATFMTASGRLTFFGDPRPHVEV